MNLVRCLFDDIMHSVYTQVCHNLAYLVHNPRRDLHHHAHSMSPRRDYNRLRMSSRDRSRRT